MNRIVEGLGGSCGTCHARGNFASEGEPPKAQSARNADDGEGPSTSNTSRITNPKDGESVLGRHYLLHAIKAISKPKDRSRQ